jgi:hypothetical protein
MVSGPVERTTQARERRKCASRLERDSDEGRGGEEGEESEVAGGAQKALLHSHPSLPFRRILLLAGWRTGGRWSAPR